MLDVTGHNVWLVKGGSHFLDQNNELCWMNHNFNCCTKPSEMNCALLMNPSHNANSPINIYPLFFRMLNEMEDDLDTATTNLSLVTIKTKELIKKSGGKRNFIIIVILTVVVILLLFLIIYT